MRRNRERNYLDSGMNDRVKKKVILIIIAIFLLLNVIFTPIKQATIHSINFLTYYCQFGIHVLEDNINKEKTEFNFEPIKIGSINLSIDNSIDDIKSDMVNEYNKTITGVGDNITKSITGQSMQEITDQINKGY